MAHSINFNTVDFGPLGLTMTSHILPMARVTDMTRVQDRAWANDSKLRACPFSMIVTITAASRAALATNLATIRGALLQSEDCVLKLDIYTDRYWNARFERLDGSFVAKDMWQGTLDFICNDPSAYANSATTDTDALTSGAGTVDLEIVQASVPYGAYIGCVCYDDEYIYIGGFNSVGRIWKLRRSDLMVVEASEFYGDDYTGAPCTIKSICCYGDYLYVGGQNPAVGYDYVWKLEKESLRRVATSADYTGAINCVLTDGTNVFVGGGTLNKVRKLLCTTLATVADSATLGGAIYDMCINGANIYVIADRGAGVSKAAKTDTATFAAWTDADTAVGGSGLGICNDGTYIYVTSFFDGIVTKYKMADMKLEVPHCHLTGVSPYRVIQSGGYLYCYSQNTKMCKIKCSDMTQECESAAGASGNYLATDGYYIFTDNQTLGTLVQVDMRTNKRIDLNDLTITSAGNVRANPVYTITADADNHWRITIENVTTGQIFYWTGDLLNGEALEIDTEMWTVKNNGVMAMEGFSGEFPQLAPGANHVHVSGVTGTLATVWRDRFA